MVDRSGCFTAGAALGLLAVFACAAVVVAGLVGDWAGAIMACWQMLCAGAAVLAWSIKASYRHHRAMRRVAYMLVGVAVLGGALAALEFAFLVVWLVECPASDTSVAALCSTADHCTERDLSCVGGGYVHLVFASVVAGLWIVTSVMLCFNGIGYAYEDSDDDDAADDDAAAKPSPGARTLEHPWRFIAPAALGTLLLVGNGALAAVGVAEDMAGTAASGWQLFSGAATVLAWAMAINYSQRAAMRPASQILTGFGVFGLCFAAAELIYVAFWLNDHPDRDASAVDVCADAEQCTVRNLAYLDNGYIQMYAVAVVAGLWVIIDAWFVWSSWGYRTEADRINRLEQRAKRTERPEQRSLINPGLSPKSMMASMPQRPRRLRRGGAIERV